MGNHRLSILTTTLLLLIPIGLLAQIGSSHETEPTSVRLSDAILNRLPLVYRDEAKDLLTAPIRTQQGLLNESDEDLTIWAVGALAEKPAAADFLLTQLEKEQSPKLRSQIIVSMRGYWRLHPQAQEIVERHVLSDPDTSLSLQGLELLWSLRTAELNRLLETRMAAAKSAGDAASIARLAPEEELRLNVEQAIELPKFLRAPPTVFAVKPSDQSIRVLAFGDFGTGSPEQVSLSMSMVAYSRKNPFDLGITLGDNFYPLGMVSPSDPRWRTQWEQLYGPLKIKFYPTFGNHDWYKDSPAAEILYTTKNPDWQFPAPYYTFTAGPVQFFALNTNQMSEEQLLWLDDAIRKSTARWKVVYGHHPIRAAANEDTRSLVERLLPLLKDRVDVYLSGHRHNLEHMITEAGVHFFIDGGGGAPLDSLKPDQRALFEDQANGFVSLEADTNHLKVTFVGIDGGTLYTDTIEK